MVNARLADAVQTEINDVLGDWYHPLPQQDSVMARVRVIMENAHPDLFDRHEAVDFSGDFMGERIDTSADVAFARFGHGADAAWVVVVFLADGFTRALRPFTADTADATWLEDYIRKELAG